MGSALDLANHIKLRENQKRELARHGQALWNMRAAFVDLKRKFPTLGTKDDDELLVDKERPPKRPKPTDTAYATEHSGTYFVRADRRMQTYSIPRPSCGFWFACNSARDPDETEGTVCSDHELRRIGFGATEGKGLLLGRWNRRELFIPLIGYKLTGVYAESVSESSSQRITARFQVVPCS